MRSDHGGEGGKRAANDRRSLKDYMEEMIAFYVECNNYLYRAKENSGSCILESS